MCCDINRNELTAKMSENLKVLKNKLGFKQSDLVTKIGVSRQTFPEIENGKCAMQWNIFLALASVFREDSGTNDLLNILGYTLLN